MNDQKQQKLNKYMELIKDELCRLIETDYNGNIEFKINLKDGGIFNANVGIHKSIIL